MAWADMLRKLGVTDKQRKEVEEYLDGICRATYERNARGNVFNRSEGLIELGRVEDAITRALPTLNGDGSTAKSIFKQYCQEFGNMDVYGQYEQPYIMKALREEGEE